MVDLVKNVGRRIAGLVKDGGPAAAAWRRRHWINRAVAGIDDALIATDHRGRVMFLNPSAETMTGWSLAEAHGRVLADVFPITEEQSGAPIEVRVPDGAPGSGTGWVKQVAVKARDGRTVPIEYRAAAIASSGGKTGGSVVLARDLTGKRRVQEAIAQMAAIVETSDDAIIGVAMDGSVMTWNEGAARLYGYPAAEIVGRPFSLLFPPDHASELGEIREAIRRGEVIRHQDTMRLHRDGSLIEVSASLSPIRGQTGTIVGFSSIARDITERKRAEAELRRSDLLRELAEAQEGERRRIAHDLHDQMEQHLAALKFGLERMLAGSPERDRIQALLEIVSQVGRDVRRIALQLRPAILDDLGLAAALVNYIGEWSGRSGIEVDFHDSGLDGDRLPRPIETALYRVVQEALTNVLKHSGADRVSLIVERRKSHLLLIVEDNGIGFDYDGSVAEANADRRLGLPGMKERIEAIGGSFLIETAAGEGTSLFVRVPLAHGEVKA